MIQKIFTTTAILLLPTLFLFILFYLFFKNENYYVYSLSINSFVLPTLHAFILFKVNYDLLKVGNYSLLKGFSFSFISLFIASLISHGAIFGFIHYLDFETEQLLTNQWFNKLKSNAIADKPKNINQIIFDLNQAQRNGISILNFKNLAIFSFMQFLFNVFICFFVSFFIRSRT
jgi:hypothetical protein